jgi:hypothetical protein
MRSESVPCLPRCGFVASTCSLVTPNVSWNSARTLASSASWAYATSSYVTSQGLLYMKASIHCLTFFRSASASLCFCMHEHMSVQGPDHLPRGLRLFQQPHLEGVFLLDHHRRLLHRWKRSSQEMIRRQEPALAIFVNTLCKQHVLL